MKPRITLITIGIDDLEKSLSFYRDGLGLPTEGIVGGNHRQFGYYGYQLGDCSATIPREAQQARTAGAHSSGVDRVSRERFTVA